MKKPILLSILISIIVSCNSKDSSGDISYPETNISFLANRPVKDAGFLFFENFDSLPLIDKFRINGRGTTTKNGKYYINREYVNKQEGNLGALASVLQNSFGKKANRAEIEIDIDKYVNNNIFNLTFDFFVPKSFVLDKENEGREVMIFQIHSQPEEGSTWKNYQENIPFNRPSIAIYYGKKGELHYLSLRYGLNGKDNTNFDNYNWFLAGVKEIQLGSWNTIKLSTKYSITNSGYIQAWLNNQTFSAFNGKDNKVYGANMHNNAIPYLKMGMYRYWADSHNHEVYFDNLIISSTIDEVLTDEEMNFLDKYPSIKPHL